MNAVRANFSEEEVVVVGVNAGDALSTVYGYISDTSIRVPILLDGQVDSWGCLHLPEGEASVYEHFRQRVGDPGNDAPFPLQIVVDAEQRIVHTSSIHEPEQIVAALRELLE